MLKKYTSNTSLSISVPLQGANNVHISFSPVTGSGSVYYTEDEELQKALEKHHSFGGLFKLEEQNDNGKKTTSGKSIKSKSTDTEEKDTEKEVGEPEPSVDNEPTSTEEKDNKETEDNSVVITIPVKDIDEAKDYLCEKFSVTRTQLSTPKKLFSFASKNNIKFEGI